MASALLEQAVSLVWGMPLVGLLVVTGVFLTLRLGLPQLSGFGHALAILRGRYDNVHDPGDINHFQALSAALSATVGLGNIAGVAIAVASGGPGALVWMWLIGFIGMATKCASCTLAVKYREIDAEGHVHGGPMHYIERGLGPAWRPMATLFALLVTLASFGGGNMFQANQVAEALSSNFGIPRVVTGLVLAAGVALVILGGIRRIGQVAAALVPAMCGIYLLGGLWVILSRLDQVPEAIALIFSDAFTGTAVAGGAVGEVIRQGVRRGTFSNEAGLGSAPIAHATARTNEPAREGLVALLEPFIDTLVVCTMTGLVIVLSGVYADPTVRADGAAMTTLAFDVGLQGFGRWFVSAAICLFAFSTVVSWSYYGEEGSRYLWGPRAVTPFRVVYVTATALGAIFAMTNVVNFSDIAYGLMAVPNVVALWLLSDTVRTEHRNYRARIRAQASTASS